MHVKQYYKTTEFYTAIQLCWKNWEEVCSFIPDVISSTNPARQSDIVHDDCNEVGPFIELYVHRAIAEPGDLPIAYHGDYITKDRHGDIRIWTPLQFKLSFSEIIRDPFEYQKNLESLNGVVLNGNSSFISTSNKNSTIVSGKPFNQDGDIKGIVVNGNALNDGPFNIPFDPDAAIGIPLNITEKMLKDLPKPEYVRYISRHFTGRDVDDLVNTIRSRLQFLLGHPKNFVYLMLLRQEVELATKYFNAKVEREIDQLSTNKEANNVNN